MSIARQSNIYASVLKNECVVEMKACEHRPRFYNLSGWGEAHGPCICLRLARFLSYFNHLHDYNLCIKITTLPNQRQLCRLTSCFRNTLTEILLVAEVLYRIFSLKYLKSTN